MSAARLSRLARRRRRRPGISACGDHPLGEAVEEEAAGAAVAVVADDDEVEAVLVGVAEEVFGRVVAFDDDVLERRRRRVRRGRATASKRLFEVAARGVDRFGAVGFGLGVGG